MTNDTFDDLISFQDLMFDLMTQETDNILSEISEEYFGDIEHFSQLFKTLIAIIKSRPFLLQNVFKFIGKILDHITKYYTKTQLMFYFSFNMSALYHLYQLKILTLDDILIQNSLAKMKIYIYFDPEIEEFYPELHKQNQSSFYFKSMKNMYTKNDIIKYRETGLNSSKYALLIQADDAESLQQLISQNNLDIDTIISRSEFETNEIFSGNLSISLIEFAVFLGSINVFKFLLMNGAQLRPIIARLSIAGGNYEIIHLLESKHIRFDAESLSVSIQFHQNQLFEYLHSTHNIPFHYKHLLLSIQYYNLFCFSSILSENSNIIQETLTEPNNLVSWACKYGNLDVLKYLSKSIDINKVQTNSTIFCIACSFGHVDIVDYLLSIESIDKTKTDRSSNSALHIASSEGNVDVVKLLVKSGMFSLNALNKFNETPLQRAIKINGFNVVNYYIHECRDQININNISTNWMTCLMTSVENGLHEIFQLILSCDGIDFNVSSKSGKTALHMAASIGDSMMVTRLLDMPGIELNSRDKDGLTPLFCAVLSNKKEIIELFWKKNGVNLLARDNCILFCSFLMEFNLLVLIILSYIMQQLKIVKKVLNTYLTTKSSMHM